MLCLYSFGLVASMDFVCGGGGSSTGTVCIPCHPWVILNIVIVNHRQHHHSRRWCHTAQQHFAIINYVHHPPDHHFLHLHFHHQQDDRSTEHLWPIINHQGSNPNHQLWSRFINHRQISIFLCVCVHCLHVYSHIILRVFQFIQQRLLHLLHVIFRWRRDRDQDPYERQGVILASHSGPWGIARRADLVNEICGWLNA